MFRILLIIGTHWKPLVGHMIFPRTFFNRKKTVCFFSLFHHIFSISSTTREPKLLLISFPFYCSRNLASIRMCVYYCTNTAVWINDFFLFIYLLILLFVESYIAHSIWFHSQVQWYWLHTHWIRYLDMFRRMQIRNTTSFAHEHICMDVLPVMLADHEQSRLSCFFIRSINPKNWFDQCVHAPSERASSFDRHLLQDHYTEWSVLGHFHLNGHFSNSKTNFRIYF